MQSGEFVSVSPGTFTPPGVKGEIFLLGGICRDCGARFFPMHAACIRCFGSAIESVRLERAGTVNSFAVVRQAPRGYFGPVPYVLGHVELADGVRVIAQLIGKDVAAWKLGDAVAARAFELPSGREASPVVQCYGFGPLSGADRRDNAAYANE